MRPLFIGFSRPKKFKLLSWLIRKVEDTDYSHVYIKFYSIALDRWLYYEAGGLMVRFCGKETFSDRNLVISEFKIDLDGDVYNKTIAWCIDNCGKPYGIIQLAGMGWVYFVKSITGKDKRNPFRDGKSSQVCSEMVGYALKENGIIDIEEDLDLAGPKKIYNIVEKFTMRK